LDLSTRIGAGSSEQTSLKRFDLNYDGDDEELKMSSKSVDLLHSKQSVFFSEVDSEDTESEDDGECTPLPGIHGRSSGIITYNETSSSDEDQDRGQAVGYTNVRNSVKGIPDKKILPESNTNSDDSSTPPPRPSKQFMAKHSPTTQQFHINEDSDSSTSSS